MIERGSAKEKDKDRKRKERTANYKLLWADVKWQRHCVVKSAATDRRCPTHTQTVRNDRQARESSDGVRCLSKDRTRGLIEGQQEGNESTLKKERSKKMRVTQKTDRCQNNQF